MRMFLRTLLLPFVGMLLCTLTAATTANGQTATISTDKGDYFPGETAIITGSGFQPGETVTLQVLHYPTCCDDATALEHQPWPVTADGSGNISSQWVVPGDLDELGATLQLTAVGDLGSSASWIFTDALQTQIINISPSSGTCGSTITVSATLQSKTGNNPFVNAGAGHLITFTLGTSTANATTNTSSVASTSITVPAVATQLVASFSGDGSGGTALQATSGNIAFTVNGSVTPSVSISTGTSSPICFGTSVTFTATATNTGGGTVTYIFKDNGTTVQSSASNTYATSTLSGGSTHPITCDISISGGSCITTSTASSNTINMTVNTGAAITGQPNPSQAVCSGGSVTFTVTATGSPTPTFQWRKNGVNLSNGGNITGASSASLTINPVGTGDAATYDVVVSNLCNTATSNGAGLTVNTPPVVTTNPVSQTACVGSQVTLTAAASGTPAPTVQWQVSINNGATFTDIGGATNTSLTVTVPSGGNNRQYRARFTNSCSTNVTTNVATITANTAATVTTNPSNVTVTAPTGASFTAAASGTAPTFQWQEDAGSGFTNLSNTGIYSGVTTTTLNLSSTTVSMNGYKYRCVATVATCGSVTSTAATLTVNNPCTPAAITTVYSNISVNNDAGSCGAIVNYPAASTTGTPTVNVSYSQASGTSFPVGTTVVTVTATNGCGTDTKTFNVVVTDAENPTITAPSAVNANNDAGVCSATVSSLGTPTTGDNCGVQSVTNDHASTSYPVGTTVVTWTVTDIHGNTNTATQNVVVTDNENPTITAPSAVNANNDAGVCSATVSSLGTPTTGDNCGVQSVTNDHASTSYPVGTTVVTWTVTDIHGNTNTATQNVVVTDNENPTITAPSAVNANNDAGVCSATVSSLGTPTTGDNCGVQSVTNDHASTSYPVGTTVVTWTVTDIHGNTNTATQNVVVTDNENPTITAPSAVNANNDAGVCSATVSSLGTPTTGDNCGVQSVTNDHASTSYPVGTTVVTWTVTDIHGNTNTATQNVVVTDNENPTITAPSAVNANNDAGVCSATVSSLGTPTTGDNCGVQSVTNDHASTSYPVGTTVVTWTVTDIHGNTNTATQNVVVTDNENPTITAPSAVNANNDAGVCSATVSSLGTPTTGDNCGVQSVTNDHASTSYPVGTTVVTWTVTDIHGNTNTATQNVVVTDNENPTITAPSAVNANNDAGVCSATVSSLGTPTTGDNCGVQSVTNDHASTSYPVGTTVVTWTVTDIHGNTNTATQNVVVTDNENPTITAPSAVNANNDAGVCSATVSSLGTPTTGDNCGVQSVSNNHPSTTYPVGTTVVTWTVTDIHGNTNTATQNVVVTDNENPTITAPSAVNANNDAGVCSATVSSLGTPTTGDNCGVQSVSNDHPSTSYPVGTTVVTWTVTDIHGNTNTATQNVVVTDNENPTITAPGAVTVNTDYNLCSTAKSNVNLGTPVTGDNCGVQSVTNDAPSVFPKGATTVTWTVTDIHGNMNTATQTVTVEDHQNPTVVGCPGPTIVISACQATASWTAPTFTDNCPGGSIMQTAGPTSPASLANGETKTVTYTATDGSGNTSICSFTISRQNALAATITNGNGTDTTINRHLYYGFAGDQTVTLKVSPTGGAGPYKVKISMDRNILCDQVNGAGDETWTSTSSYTAGKVDSNAVCGGTFYTGVTTRTANTGIGTGGYLQVTATLMDTTTITICITDVNGCTTTVKENIFAEDDRCFAGKSPVQKIQLCHRTGSTSNPCVTICVDSSAVAEHLAHGDSFGACPKVGCGTSYNNQSPIAVAESLSADKLHVTVMPNPSVRGTDFNLTTTGKADQQIQIRVMNMLGKEVYGTKGAANQTYKFGGSFISGVYLVEVLRGNEVHTLKVIKQ